MHEPSQLANLLSRLAAAPRSRRSPVVLEILPLLADARIPEDTRVAAAARVLALVPDRRGPVLRIVRAVTVGVPPSRALARLRNIQHELPTSTALDAIIDTREEHISLACPRCRVRLKRVDMIKHLWHEHQQELVHRKTRSREQILNQWKDDFSATGSAEALDRLANRGGVFALRQWLANEATAEETAPLLATAAEQDAGLCPECFATVQIRVRPMPPPLVLKRGWLAGDGYVVEVGGNAWWSTVAVATPQRRRATVKRRLAPRLIATLGAMLVLVAAMVSAPTLNWFFLILMQAAILYFLILFLRERRDINEVAIDSAWQLVAGEVTERGDAARFLTRLCLTSLGRGDVEARAKLLAMIANRASRRTEDSSAELQLFAAASVLQVEDASRYGRDVVAGVAEVAARGFRGELSADFAEYATAAYRSRDRDPGDVARLQILLIAAAFDAGLGPRDLRDLWFAAPALKETMGIEPLHRVGLLHGLWRTRGEKAWEAIAPVRTVFDLAREAPRTAAGILARYPDLLLLRHHDPGVESQVGPVLVCARGVAIGGHVVADADATVRLAANGRLLVFGRHRIPVMGGLLREFVEELRRWLRFRTEKLLPLIDDYLAGGTREVLPRVLRPFAGKCPRCGVESVVARGAVSRRLQ